MNRQSALQRTKTLFECFRKYSNRAELVISHNHVMVITRTAKIKWLLLSGKNADEQAEHGGCDLVPREYSSLARELLGKISR